MNQDSARRNVMSHWDDDDTSHGTPPLLPKDDIIVSPSRVPTMDDEEVIAREINDRVHRALIQSSMEELQDVVAVLQESSVYSIQDETIRSWGHRLRAISQNVLNCVTRMTLVAPTANNTKRNAKMSATATPSNNNFCIGEVSSAAGVGNAQIISTHVASSLFIIVDTVCSSVGAAWGNLFVFVQASDKLVLVCSCGQRGSLPGSVKINAGASVERNVLENGIAISISPTTEVTFSGHPQDRFFDTRTKSMLVFPIFKPGSSTEVVGVVEFCNKDSSNSPFTADDEVRAMEAATILSNIMMKYPNDVTCGSCLDSGLHTAAREFGVGQQLSCCSSSPRQQQLIFRTWKNPRRDEFVEHATALPRAMDLESVMDHVVQVNDSWRNAVLLNIELELEIRRLNEALLVSRKEIARLQDAHFHQ